MSNLDLPWTEVDLVVVDVEGNGQSPPELVEVAVLRITKGKRAPSVDSWLIRPPRPITPIVRRIHGISNDDVAGAPTIGDLSSEIQRSLRDAIPLGQSVHIDIEALSRQLTGGWSPEASLDTRLIARRLLPGRAKYSLDSLIADLGLGADLPAANRHRAGYDVAVTWELFLALVGDLGPLASVRSILELCGKSAVQPDPPASLF